MAKPKTRARLFTVKLTARQLSAAIEACEFRLAGIMDPMEGLDPPDAYRNASEKFKAARDRKEPTS